MTSRPMLFLKVSNTPWLEETLYVHPVNTKDTYEDMKKMHVSPFQPMGQMYKWTAPFPSTEVSPKGRRVEK